MLLYITAEDVFGNASPERRGPRPLHTIPPTLAALYDLGFRHHVRPAVLTRWEGASPDPMPDWKLDRLAIRLALFARERLGGEPGARLALLGGLGWLWPAVDFAAMGFGLTPVGIEHDASDEAVEGVLAEAAPRVVFAADAGSAGRLVRLRRSGRIGDATVVADGLPQEDGLLPLAELLDRAAVLDTAERAQAFRAFSRQVSPEGPALWHAGSGGVVRLTHRQAMTVVAGALRSRPALPGDVAYLDAPRVTLRKRLALAAFVGDGHTTTALGREGRAAEDLGALRPHKVVASEGWPAYLSAGRSPRWPGGLDRRRAARVLRAAFGGRVRWIEAAGPLAGDAARALDAAGIVLDAAQGETGGWVS
jgi:hypothetical protein